MNNVYGLIGEKLSHSISPEIHNSIFEKTDYKGKYYIFEIEKNNLKSSIDGFRLLKIGGLNVTIPYKIDVIERMDCISDEAREIGAINTIKFKDGKCYGYNTDYYGFSYMFDKNNIDVKGKSTYVLGAGGATKAIIKYLRDKNASSINIVTRDVSKTKGNLEFKEYNVISYEDLEKIDAGDIIINSTPLGMYPNINNCPVSEDVIKKFKVAMDIIYNPSETMFLKHGKKWGLICENGLPMLIGQAVYAQEIFRDITIDKSIIDEICREFAVKY
ncbi:shikimate dehydrogenase [Clostridium sp.]|uniref:shikimate dehydrogenase n=1 Tax=Clostridium sp. TaxID=1506 RepID=UPI002FCA5F34